MKAFENPTKPVLTFLGLRSSGQLSSFSPLRGLSNPKFIRPTSGNQAARIRSCHSAMTSRVKSGESSTPDSTPAIPRPSASVLLISPTNEILLLHRVKTSSAFAAAHVFPGGNIEPEQDGSVPPTGSLDRHTDGEAYRRAAIRETFEESGILLAKDKHTGGLLEVADRKREKARKEIHRGVLKFTDWLYEMGGVADTDGLIPFTHWITPVAMRKRFTTQMYLYFLPIASPADSLPYRSAARPALTSGSEVFVPTADGGLEHTAARFLRTRAWLQLAASQEVILFEPQFFLIHQIAPFLSPNSGSDVSNTGADLSRQRDKLMRWLAESRPPWADKYISPTPIGTMSGAGDDGTPQLVLALDRPGEEIEALLQDSEERRRGDEDWVVLSRFKKEGPRNLELRRREEVLKLMEEKAKL